jgi:hypothetical protein
LTLLKHYDKVITLNNENINKHTEEIKNYLKKSEITMEDLKEVSKIEYIMNDSKDSHSLGVVKSFVGEEIKDLIKIDEFSILWRKHFLSFLKPDNYLNKFWDVNRSLIRN